MHHKFTYAELLNYLAEIAEKSKFIDTSFELQNVDPTVELQKLGGKTVMLIEDPKARVSQGSGARLNQFATFNIIKYRNTKSAIIPKARDIKDECQRIAVHILSFLNNELRNGKLATDLDGVDMHPVDYLEMNWHGYRVVVPIKTPIDLSYKADDWNN